MPFRLPALGDRLRCRPGDLAIVTRCRVPERIGLIVRVVERCFEDGYDWVTDIQGPGTKGRDVHTGAICICSEMLARDESLTPIRGEPLADSESVSRTRPAPVA